MKKRNTKSIGDPECETCGGSGYIPIKEGDPEYEQRKKLWGKQADAYAMNKRCVCLLKKQFRTWVGDPIYKARPLEESPLLGREEDNLFITASRPDFLAHMRFVLAHHDFTYFWKMTSDSDLRDIFVGNHEDYPAISNFVKPPDLVVIQLAVLSYKNVAMSGVVLEALRTRQFDGMATWLVNPYDCPFREGHLAWSPELEYFLDESFEEVKLKNTHKGKSGSGSGSGSSGFGNKNPSVSGKRASIQDNIDI